MSKAKHLDTSLFDCMTSIRGIFALQVVMFHYTQFWLLEPGTVRRHLPFFENIHILVDMFFIMSGFIICFVHAHEYTKGFDRQAFRRFMWLRFGRIVPSHWLILGGFLAIELLNVALGDPGAFQDLDRTPQSVVSNLLLVNAWGLEPNLTWNYPTWSLSVEWGAYLLFPLFVWALLSTSPWVCGFVTVCFMVAQWWLWQLDPSLQYDRTYDLGLIRGITGFGLGVTFYRFYAAIGYKWVPSAAVVTPLGVLAMVLLFGLMLTDVPDPIIIWFFILWLMIFMQPHNKLNKILNCKPLMVIGDLSFTIYVLHAFTQRIFAKLVHMGFIQYDTLFESVVFALVIEVITVGIAALIYYKFETPARVFIRARFADKFKRKVGTAVA